MLGCSKHVRELQCIVLSHPFEISGLSKAHWLRESSFRLETTAGVSIPLISFDLGKTLHPYVLHFPHL